MEIKELMILDWLIWDDVTPCQVTAIGCDYIETTKCGITLAESHLLKGIPLTPEILKKNGFKKGFIPALKTESSLLWVANVGDDYIEVRFDRGNIAIWYDYDENNDGVYCDCYLPLPYWLHDFQHALRLCGINKEIEI